ncbi:hypothetical protein QWA68_015693 [Fusarium oxysporum]|nr:hypothetical protein QWA68_015693 [Fusarium oxysporum]
MESIHHVARLLRAIKRQSNERHNDEQLPNAVVVRSSTTVSTETIKGQEEAHIGVETIVTTRQTMWAASVRLLYAGNIWVVSKTEIAGVF